MEELEEADEDDGASDAVRSGGRLDDEPVRQATLGSGWLNLGMAVLSLGGIIIGAATVSEGQRPDPSTATASTARSSAPRSSPRCWVIEDLFLTVRPIRKGVPEIGIGNVIGSLVFSVTGKLGIVVLAGGGIIAIGTSVLRWHLPVLIGLTALSAYFLSTGQIKRWHGFVLLALYIGYWVISYVVYGGAPIED